MANSPVPAVSLSLPPAAPATPATPPSPPVLSSLPNTTVANAPVNTSQPSPPTPTDPLTLTLSNGAPPPPLPPAPRLDISTIARSPNASVNAYPPPLNLIPTLSLTAYLLSEWLCTHSTNFGPNHNSNGPST
ncbi:hypothetical protein WJX73_010205 [Symbiochloris irregularis]|uniref:Uncharacterized protein n=1 Tax=Symbiochloris irregularis TaxID=706552 RepID=A0AAW1NUQ7_9CHLO